MEKRAHIVSGLAALAALFLAPLAEASLTRSSAPAREALALTLAAPEPSEFSLFDGTEIARALASRPALISISTDEERSSARTRFVPSSELSADELPEGPELVPITSVREQRFNLHLPPDVFGIEPLRGPPGDEASYPKTRYRVFGLLGTPILGELRGVSLELHWRSASFSAELSSGTVGWLSQDPLDDRDSPNLYGFVRMRPHELTDPMGLESVRQWLNIDSDIEQGNFLSALGKTTVYNVWNAFTFGFVGEHDKAFETTNGAEYLARTTAALGKSTAIGAATLATGGGVAVATRGLNLAVSGGLTAGSSTFAGMATEDVISASTGGQTHSAKEYAVNVGGATALGVALGVASNRFPGLLDPIGGQPAPLRGGNRLDLARKAQLASEGFQTNNPRVSLPSGRSGVPDAVNATNVTEVTQVDFGARGYNARPATFRSRIFAKVAKTQAYQQAFARPTSTLEIFARPGSSPTPAQMLVIQAAQQAYPGVSIRLMGPSATVPIIPILPRQSD